MTWSFLTTGHLSQMKMPRYLRYHYHSHFHLLWYQSRCHSRFQFGLAFLIRVLWLFIRLFLRVHSAFIGIIPVSEEMASAVAAAAND
ncbi:hypothetical protein EYF80_007919 [Liparis tanakae]|uniref:Uncharacterized protein n=1 Tax=Liparis tanakae TaxID=230148 RepID=A0A4Z2IUY6_9TELE|nr:hypothetical protein EYF80_007919 [Liparis tanakae]